MGSLLTGGIASRGFAVPASRETIWQDPKQDGRHFSHLVRCLSDEDAVFSVGKGEAQEPEGGLKPLSSQSPHK